MQPRFTAKQLPPGSPHGVSRVTTKTSTLSVDHEMLASAETFSDSHVQVNPLLLQVQAFLDASEDVDMDAEVFEDLIQVLSSRQQDHTRKMTTSIISEDDGDENGLAAFDFEELDISALYTVDEGDFEQSSRV